MAIAVAISFRPVRRWIRDQAPSVFEWSRRAGEAFVRWLLAPPPAPAPVPVAERVPSV